MEQMQIMMDRRSITGKKVKTLRRKGIVPVVVYGKTTEPINLQAIEFDLKRKLIQASGQLMAVTVKGEEQPRMVLAYGVQRNPITGELIHVDLYEVNMAETVQVNVQLNLIGEAKLVSIGEASLLQVLTDVEIECLPADIMQAIDIDISELVDIDDALYVKDLVVPSSATILTSKEELIVKLNPAVEIIEEEEEDEFAVVDAAGEVEVIERGKAEDEDFEE